jgi:hypothetical protein
MRVMLDAGALIAIDRRDRQVGAMLRALQQRGIAVRTTAPVLAQVWRDGSKQVNLAATLPGLDRVALETGIDRAVGELLSRSRTSDVVDAHVALSVSSGDKVLTSDPVDIERLLDVRGVRAQVVRV